MEFRPNLTEKYDDSVYDYRGAPGFPRALMMSGLSIAVRSWPIDGPSSLLMRRGQWWYTRYQ